MQQCPHCGFDVDGEPACPNCGQSSEALPDQPHAESAAVPDAPPAVEPAADAETEGEDESGDTIQVSRRALLGGAGASIALLGAGGAGWMVLRGGGEGQRVIKSYVDAMATNDFARVPDLYHDDAPLMRQIEQSNEFDGFADYLEQREVLETWRNIQPELKSIEELYHITEVTEESLNEVDIRTGPPPTDVEAFRQVVAFVAVSVGAMNEEQESTAKYYDGGTRRLPLTCSVVRSAEGWQLWTARTFLP